METCPVWSGVEWACRKVNFDYSFGGGLISVTPAVFTTGAAPRPVESMNAARLGVQALASSAESAASVVVAVPVEAVATSTSDDSASVSAHAIRASCSGVSITSSDVALF